MTSLTATRTLAGIGNLRGPTPNTHFLKVVELVSAALPLFADAAQKEKIKNENGLNKMLSRFITNVGDNMHMPYIAQPESMEDETRGDSPAPDIGIHLKVDDISCDPPKITVFEGKRLSSRLGIKRRHEYVLGQEQKGKYVRGGIKRFKQSIHGRAFDSAGMIGYLQDGTAEEWLEKINNLISELSTQEHDPAWSVEERLTLSHTNEKVTKCSSIVYRHNSKLNLLHLWVDLVQ